MATVFQQFIAPFRQAKKEVAITTNATTAVKKTLPPTPTHPDQHTRWWAPLCKCKCLLQDIRGQESNIFRGRQLGDIGMTVSIASSGSGDLCYGHICNKLLNGQSEWDISIPQSLCQAHDRPLRSTTSRELWSPSSCTTSLTGAHTAMGLMWSGNIMEAHNTQDFQNSEEL